MKPRIKAVINCPHCGMENLAAEDRCRTCGKGLTVYIGPAANLPRRFGVGSLMLLVLAMAPGLAALRPSPAFGVVLLIIMTPAAIRTTAVVAQRGEDRRPLTLDGKILAFLGSIGMMIVVGSVSALAFGLLWIPISSLLYTIGPAGLALAALIAGAIASAVAYVLLRRLWPYRDS